MGLLRWRARVVWRESTGAAESSSAIQSSEAGMGAGVAASDAAALAGADGDEGCAGGFALRSGMLFVSGERPGRWRTDGEVHEHVCF